MKAIIWIIVLLLIGWGIWWWVGRDNVETTTTTETPNTAQVQGASDSLDISEFGDKG